jgi:hypothetical protein
LHNARAAIRAGEFDRAQVLLSEWDQTAWTDAECLNLLGVLAVARSDWKQAVRYWRAAVRADRRYAPPRQNLRRHYELFQFGRSRVEISLGEQGIPQSHVNEVECVA